MSLPGKLTILLKAIIMGYVNQNRPALDYKGEIKPMRSQEELKEIQEEKKARRAKLKKNQKKKYNKRKKKRR